MAAKRKIGDAKKGKSKKTQAKTRKAEPTSEPPKSGDDLLDMAQAIEMLKTTRPTFYRWLKSGKIKGMKVGRQWRFEREDIQRFLRGQQPRVEVHGNVGGLIDQLLAALAELGAEEMQCELDNNGQISQAIALMMYLAVKSKASDIHIQPTGDARNTEGLLCYRIDGALIEKARFDKRLVDPLVARWKTFCGCDINEKSLPQTGRVSAEINKQHSQFIVSFFPSYLGETLTVRRGPTGSIMLTLDAMPFHGEDRKRIEQAVESSFGLILCTGPAGCGKTTTLHGCANRINTPSLKIMSIEDPVEIQIPGWIQSQVNEAAGLTYEKLARAILRSDPDVIVVGEIMNLETADICVQAALTGHLVFSQLHTTNTANTLGRLIDMGVPGFVLAEAIRLIVSQRLVRKLCSHCSKPLEFEPEQRRSISKNAREGGWILSESGNNFRSPIGCKKCHGGYSGRTLIVETLEMSPAIAEALRKEAPTDEIRRISIAEGMTTLYADGIRRASVGETTLLEVMRVMALR